MKLRCPKCKYEYDFREGTKEKALLDVIRMQADFAPHSGLVFEYAELFDTTRPMKALKLCRVLKELRDLYVNERFVLNKRVYRVSKNGIAEALKTVCNRTFPEPLQNHNYLKKVLVSVAETEEKQRSTEAEKRLREKEAALRAGNVRRTDTDNGAVPIGEAAKKLPWRRD